MCYTVTISQPTVLTEVSYSAHVRTLKVPASKLAEWMLLTWKQIPEVTVVTVEVTGDHFFKKCCITNAFDAPPKKKIRKHCVID